MSTLATILKDNWEWREKICNLALFDLKKQSRGAVLGWAWFFVQPLVYVFCFWFAIEVGMRAGRASTEDAPFILWLTAGLIPWFFMSKMLGAGLDVFHRYPYLVNKIKFPLSAISSIYTLSTMIIQLMLQLILVVVYVACGQAPDIHLIQVPFLLILMYGFWYFVSLLFSPLCAMSKDVKNLMNALATPFFWLSGILFEVRTINVSWIQDILYFNPITFFATAFRDAVCDKLWIWEDPMMCIGFVIVFVVTAVLGLVVYKKTNKEVADVL
ncbi:MAG: ABC transporter permease [Eggerthellaceae bacterium]|nr:ABC transporter permease [Eggerthellaceae bacterium]